MGFITAVTAALTKRDISLEPRDPHTGEWITAGGVAREIAHAVAHAGDMTTTTDTKQDRLNLAGKIHLDPGEHLAGSGKVSSRDGSVRLAATAKDGRRLLRIGVGNAAFGTRAGGGPWTGGPDRYVEIAAQRGQLAAQREDLEDAWDNTDDEAEKADIQRRIDAIDEADGALPADEPAGYTTRLDAAGARELRDVLADVLTRATAEEDRVNGLWDEFETADARLDEMDAWPPGRVWSQAEKNEYQQVLARRQDLGEQLGADRVNDTSYTTFTEGSIPGDWGTLHYSSILDDPTVGTETKLFVVPPGADPDDITGNEEHYILDLDEVDELINQLDRLT